MSGGHMSQTASLREQLYELSQTAKTLAESRDITVLTTDDAWFISTVNTTLINIKNERGIDK